MKIIIISFDDHPIYLYSMIYSLKVFSISNLLHKITITIDIYIYIRVVVDDDNDRKNLQERENLHFDNFFDIEFLVNSFSFLLKFCFILFYINIYIYFFFIFIFIFMKEDLNVKFVKN